MRTLVDAFHDGHDEAQMVLPCGSHVPAGSRSCFGRKRSDG